MNGDYWMQITTTDNTLRLTWADPGEAVGWTLYSTGAVVYLRRRTRRELRGPRHRQERRQLRHAARARSALASGRYTINGYRESIGLPPVAMGGLVPVGGAGD